MSPDLPHVELRRRFRHHRAIHGDHLPRVHALLLLPYGATRAQGTHEILQGLLEPSRVRHAGHGHRRHRHVRNEETVRRLRHEAARRERIG